MKLVTVDNDRIHTSRSSRVSISHIHASKSGSLVGDRHIRSQKTSGRKGAKHLSEPRGRDMKPRVSGPNAAGVESGILKAGRP